VAHPSAGAQFFIFLDERRTFIITKRGFTMKKICMWLVMAAVLFIFCPAWAGTSPTLSITGLVKRPVNLSLSDLRQYQSVEAQLNEVFEDGTYRGAFVFRGVPLKTLLETAFIQKEDSWQLRRSTAIPQGL